MTSDLAAALDVVSRRARQGPVAIVFANSAYRDVLLNWLRHATDAGFDNAIVAALDDEIWGDMAAQGVPSFRMSFEGPLSNLWIARARLFSVLCNAGLDFLHSDADAVWLRNPAPGVFDLDVDLAFSPGTVWPFDIVEAWGFVLCCGFFAVRACPAASSFFEDAAARAEADKDDQIAFNRVLWESGVEWTYPESFEDRAWLDRTFRSYDEPVLGRSPSLSIALLPHGDYPRLPEVTDRTVVAHPLSPKTLKGKAEVLGRLGLWHR